ncbi:MAG: isochorismate synthase [Endozoicomonas sp.]
MSVLADRLKHLLDSGYPDQTLVRVELPVGRVNLLEWLSAQVPLNRSLWADREGDLEIAGLGCTWQYQLHNRSDITPCFEAVNSLLEIIPKANSARCLGYLSFSDSASAVWPQYGYGKFFLPTLEIAQTRKGSVLACNLFASDSESWMSGIRAALEIIEGIRWEGAFGSGALALHSMTFRPDEDNWHALINKATTDFRAGDMEKVVLSREACLSYSGQLDPWHLLQQWRMSNPRSFLYAFESDSGSQEPEVFLGCSPERLFSRQGRLIRTEALAGTAARGRDRDEDFQMELRLLNDSKNLHENRLVLDDIRERLSPLCDSLESDRSHSVIKLKTVQHLRFLFRGILKKEVDDSELLSCLHPTPAVGGSSREKALEFIEANEPYSRGLYSGACGYIGRDNSELSVSLRCGLLQENTLSLFSGAGIVKGSEAEDEWQELDNKILTVLGLLKERENHPGDNSNEHAAGRPSNPMSIIKSREVSDEFSHQAS